MVESQKESEADKAGAGARALEELQGRLSVKALEAGSRELGVEELSELCEAALPRLEGYRGEAKRGARLKIIIPPQKRLTAIGDGARWRIKGSSAEAILSLEEGGWTLESVGSSSGSYAFNSGDPTPIQARARLTSAAALALAGALRGERDEERRLLGWMRSGLLGVDDPILDDDREIAAGRFGSAESRAPNASALWLSAAAGRGEELARGLIGLGADPNAKGPGELSPLAILARGCRTGDRARCALAGVLLEAGANPLDLDAEAVKRVEAWAEAESPAAALLAGARRAAGERLALMESADGARGSAGRPGL